MTRYLARLCPNSHHTRGMHKDNITTLWCNYVIIAFVRPKQTFLACREANLLVIIARNVLHGIFRGWLIWHRSVGVFNKYQWDQTTCTRNSFAKYLNESKQFLGNLSAFDMIRPVSIKFLAGLKAKRIHQNVSCWWSEWDSTTISIFLSNQTKSGGLKNSSAFF